MPVESATYITDLVPTDPNINDPLQQGQQHIGLIKQVLQNTFPSLSGPVTANQTDLSNVAGMMTPASGTLKVPAATASGDTFGGSLSLTGSGSNTNINLSNPAGNLQVFAGNTTILTVDATGNAVVPGTLNATSVMQGGYPLLPAGAIIMWSGTVASIPAGWQLCDGTNGTPDLRGMFIVGAGDTGAGATYGPWYRGGAASQSVATASAGSHYHGGITGEAGAHGHVAGTDTQGSHNHGGADGAHALTWNEMPSHAHTQTVFSAAAAGGPASQPSGGGGGSSIDSTLATEPAGGNQPHSHSIGTDGQHSHNVWVDTVPDHQHGITVDGAHAHVVTVSTMPPYFALCLIYKL